MQFWVVEIGDVVAKVTLLFVGFWTKLKVACQREKIWATNIAQKFGRKAGTLSYPDRLRNTTPVDPSVNLDIALIIGVLSILGDFEIGQSFCTFVL